MGENPWETGLFRHLALFKLHTSSGNWALPFCVINNLRHFFPNIFSLMRLSHFSFHPKQVVLVVTKFYMFVKVSL